MLVHSDSLNSKCMQSGVRY